MSSGEKGQTENGKREFAEVALRSRLAKAARNLGFFRAMGGAENVGAEEAGWARRPNIETFSVLGYREWSPSTATPPISWGKYVPGEDSRWRRAVTNAS